MPKSLLRHRPRHPAITAGVLLLYLATDGASVYLFAVPMRQRAITSD